MIGIARLLSRLGKNREMLAPTCQTTSSQLDAGPARSDLEPF